MQNNQQNDITQSTLMVDRYRYLDLLPCNSYELKAIGFKDPKVAIQQQAQATANASTNNTTNTNS